MGARRRPLLTLCRSGETGRRAGLKIRWALPPVWVRPPPPAPTLTTFASAPDVELRPSPFGYAAGFRHDPPRAHLPHQRSLPSPRRLTWNSGPRPSATPRASGTTPHALTFRTNAHYLRVGA